MKTDIKHHTKVKDSIIGEQLEIIFPDFPTSKEIKAKTKKSNHSRKSYD